MLVNRRSFLLGTIASVVGGSLLERTPPTPIDVSPPNLDDQVRMCTFWVRGAFSQSDQCVPIYITKRILIDGTHGELTEYMYPVAEIGYNIECESGYVFAGEAGDHGAAVWLDEGRWQIIQIECP